MTHLRQHPVLYSQQWYNLWWWRALWYPVLPTPFYTHAVSFTPCELVEEMRKYFPEPDEKQQIGTCGGWGVGREWVTSYAQRTLVYMWVLTPKNTVWAYSHSSWHMALGTGRQLCQGGLGVEPWLWSPKDGEGDGGEDNWENIWEHLSLVLWTMDMVICRVLSLDFLIFPEKAQSVLWDLEFWKDRLGC